MPTIMERMPVILLPAIIFIFGIIHFAVGVGIIARNNVFQEIFRQSIALSAVNIIIGLLAVAVGVIGVMVILDMFPALMKVVFITSIILGICALVSLIAALALNSQSVTYVKKYVTYRIETYDDVDDSSSVVDILQQRYQCCGEDSWLDWAPANQGLDAGTGSNAGGTGTISTGTGSSGTGTVSTGTGSIGTSGTSALTTGNKRRRRRSLSPQLSPLIQAVRRTRRQTSVILNTPLSYTFKLPLSCCINGGVTTANSQGGYCTYSGNNDTSAFYTSGCVAPVANVVVSEITGYAVINTFLTILAFTFVAILINLAPGTMNPNNPDGKQPPGYEIHQDQPQQFVQPPFDNSGYYANNADPTAYYNNGVPTYSVYQ